MQNFGEALPKLIGIGGFPHKVLPEGAHHCNPQNLRQRFVDEFPASATRKTIFKGLMRLQVEAQELGICGTQWVNGSFVTSKKNPNDVDVVTFINSTLMNNLHEKGRDFVWNILSGGTYTIETYNVHAFLVLVHPEEHLLYNFYEKKRRYWRRWWGATVPVDSDDDELVDDSKGFLVLKFGDVKYLIPKVSEGV